MIEDFPEPASLPGGPMKGPPSDFSTFHNIWKVAENLVGNCVMKIGQVGWQPTGKKESKKNFPHPPSPSLPQGTARHTRSVSFDLRTAFIYGAQETAVVSFLPYAPD